MLAAVASAAVLPCLDETLPNGIRVLAHEQPSAPNVAIALELAHGAAEDPPGEAGLAHLVEHVSYEGSAHAPEGGYDRWLAEAGGENQGWTGPDHVVFTAEAPAGALDRLLFLESDRLGWPVVTEEALANQRAVVAAERASRRRAYLSTMAAETLLWPEGHPYARSVVGTDESIAGVTVEELRAFAGRILDPEGAVVAVVGPRPAEELMAAARRWFGEVPARARGARGETPVVDAPGEAPGKGRRTWIEADVWPVILQVGWRTVDERDPEGVALEISASILWNRLAVEGVDALEEGSRLGGTFTMEVETERPRRALRRIEREVAALGEEGPTEEELERARRALRLEDLRSLETAEGRALALVACARIEGSPDCLEERWGRFAATDTSDVSTAVSRWLTPEAEVVLAITPRGDPAPLGGMVRGEEP